MSIDYGLKIRQIREAEGFGRSEFAKTINVPVKTLIGWETRGIEPKASAMTAVCQAFPQYTLWLMTDTVQPESGQISPEIELARRENNLKAAGDTN
jgi:DNA-binding XRE family transcriptional regulator